MAKFTIYLLGLLVAAFVVVNVVGAVVGFAIGAAIKLALLAAAGGALYLGGRALTRKALGSGPEHKQLRP